MAVITCISVKFGFGRHNSVQAFDDINPSLTLAFASRLTYQVSLGTTKLGLGAFYLRILPDRISRYATYLLMGFTILYTLPLGLVTIFQCSPIAGAWSTISAKCINISAIFIASAVCSMVTDVLLLALIIPRIGIWFHPVLNTADPSNNI
jgi:hypothetical protein